MCRLPVARGAPAFFEHGDVIHLDCHLGLMDAGAAIARLLRARPGQPLCVSCIANALTVTLVAAQTGIVRLRPLAGFETRYDVCLGCGGRRQVLRALRAPGPRSPGESRTA